MARRKQQPKPAPADDPALQAMQSLYAEVMKAAEGLRPHAEQIIALMNAWWDPKRREETIAAMGPELAEAAIGQSLLFSMGTIIIGGMNRPAPPPLHLSPGACA